MSQQYIAALVVIIVSIAQFGTIDWTSPSIVTPIVTSAIFLIAGAWIAYRRYKQGGITLTGSVIK